MKRELHFCQQPVIDFNCEEGIPFPMYATYMPFLYTCVTVYNYSNLLYMNIYSNDVVHAHLCTYISFQLYDIKLCFSYNI